MACQDALVEAAYHSRQGIKVEAFNRLVRPGSSGCAVGFAEHNRCVVKPGRVRVAGQGVAQQPGRDGQTREVTFTLKADGDNLPGTVSGRGGDTAISEGKISGDAISFVVERSFNEKKIRQIYKGQVSGNEIKFKVSTEGADRTIEMTAKRAGS
jgi:hypothetical protein